MLHQRITIDRSRRNWPEIVMYIVNANGISVEFRRGWKQRYSYEWVLYRINNCERLTRVRRTRDACHEWPQYASFFFFPTCIDRSTQIVSKIGVARGRCRPPSVIWRRCYAPARGANTTNCKLRGNVD